MTTPKMPLRHKILLLDDEQDLLDTYKEFLGQLPSQPEIYTCTSGARAIALLESEPFTLLISDLKMPKMDGLQVLSIVRRKFPHLRIVVMTCVTDEHYRSRAYAMGIDLFWEKPGNAKEVKLFQECIESLLGRKDHGGFRGVQHKSLVDIIQLECLSHSSSVLKFNKAGQEGRVWVYNGDLIDAVAGDLTGEEAFREIFSWKTGNFEIQPAEPQRTRTIFNSWQGLLLDSAQALDESLENGPSEENPDAETLSPAARLGRYGVEFAVIEDGGAEKKLDGWGLESPETMAGWARETQRSFHALGEKLNAGELRQIEGLGLQQHAAVIMKGSEMLCAGFNRSFNAEQLRRKINFIYSKWAS